MNDPLFDEKLIALRRDFHKYPETGWQEYRTTVHIVKTLEAMGIRVLWGKDIHAPEAMLGLPSAEEEKAAQDRAAKETGQPDMIQKMAGCWTGAVGIIEGELPGPFVAIRVDIDCNDLDESQDASHRPFRDGFASLHPGSMHACGHDGHIAIGLGVAEILCRNRSRLKGKVMLIFQAAEEGGRGAQSLVKKGLLEGVDYLFSGHLGFGSGYAPFGAVAASSRGFLSGTKFDAFFTGLAAHAGAAPEKGHNAIAAASTAVLNLLALPRSGKGISRVNVGTIHGGSGRNVIPDHAVLRAEVRGGNGEVADWMFENAQRVCKTAAEMYQCDFSYKVMGKSEDSECDPDLVSLVMQSASSFSDVSEVVECSQMGGGDNVTFMMNDVRRRGGKVTYMRLGADITVPAHSKNFDFNEKVIPLGARLYAKLAHDIGEAAN